MLKRGISVDHTTVFGWVKRDGPELGTGVLIPSNRIAPVAANALASLNQLAPGRIDFGLVGRTTGWSS